MKNIKSFNLFKTNEEMEMENDGGLLPKMIVDSFIRRIKSRLEEKDNKLGKNHPSIKRELDRIKSINADKIPDRIQKLLDDAN